MPPPETSNTDNVSADNSSATTPPPPPPQIAAFRRPQISPPSSLVVDVNTADNWKMWRQTWENYCVIADLGTQPEDYKCALLLHSIGTDALRIYNGFKFTEGEDRNKMADIITKFEQHFLGQTQEFFERFQFNRRNQEPGGPSTSTSPL